MAWARITQFLWKYPKCLVNFCTRKINVARHLTIDNLHSDVKRVPTRPELDLNWLDTVSTWTLFNQFCPNRVRPISRHNFYHWKNDKFHVKKTFQRRREGHSENTEYMTNHSMWFKIESIFFKQQKIIIRCWKKKQSIFCTECMHNPA